MLGNCCVRRILHSCLLGDGVIPPCTDELSGELLFAHSGGDDLFRPGLVDFAMIVLSACVVIK